MTTSAHVGQAGDELVIDHRIVAVLDYKGRLRALYVLGESGRLLRAGDPEPPKPVPEFKPPPARPVVLGRPRSYDVPLPPGAFMWRGQLRLP